MFSGLTDTELNEYTSVLFDDFDKDTSAILMGRLYNINKKKKQQELDKDTQWLDNYLLNKITKPYQEAMTKKFDDKKKISINIPNAEIKRTNPRTFTRDNIGKSENIKRDDEQHNTNKRRNTNTKSRRKETITRDKQNGKTNEESIGNEEIEEVAI